MKSNYEKILEFAEGLIQKNTETYCSELQRSILLTALQGNKTYDQLADECGYSAKYVKQDVAPKLWFTLSQALDRKITKSTARSVLEQEMAHSKHCPARSRTQTNFQADSINQASLQTLQLPDSLSKSQANILLVDDQPNNLRLLSDLFEEQGYEVQQAINGTVALQAATLDKPDLILLDIHMPDMNGYTVCQKLKANLNTQDIPVIFISALDEAWDKVRAFSVGGVDYITKPFKVIEVIARVENQLTIGRLQTELKAQNIVLQQALQELQRVAALDDLTQVANRRRFDQYLLERWKQGQDHQTPLTMMLCQIDKFNFYSDDESTKLGDQCIFQVAQLIKRKIQRSEDLVCRYGIMTFAIIMPQQSVELSESLATSLLETIKKLKITSLRPGITMSIGMKTLLPNEKVGLESYIEDCEQNLLQAKNEGGDRLIFS